MRIGFIGAGKVGTAFGRYLGEKGISVSGYLGRNAEKVAHACAVTQGQAFDDHRQLARASDIILITTGDDQIEEACNTLCDAGAVEPRHLVGHMSGAHSSLILKSAARNGAVPFSLHPLQAFAQEDKAVADLSHTYFSLEGDTSRIKPVEAILQQTDNPYFLIKAETKSLYHLSACIFSNYLVSLMAAGTQALKASGIEPGEGFQAMLPLIEGTIANIARLGPAKALTGPIARGDITTIQHHLAALTDHNLMELRTLYAFMGLKTLDLASLHMLNDRDRADALRQTLEGGVTLNKGVSHGEK